MERYAGEGGGGRASAPDQFGVCRGEDSVRCEADWYQRCTIGKDAAGPCEFGVVIPTCRYLESSQLHCTPLGTNLYRLQTLRIIAG